ncbi:MAG TPA: cation:proton antiporter [Dehalococcoidia bacterium]|nr:cation:proton antiporter [Dehalococcoidia bacterium]
MDNQYTIAAIWMGLAFVAAMLAGWTGISVSVLEILVGVAAGNFLHLGTNTWIVFLAGFGSVLLTFLAGAEIDPSVLRRRWRETFSIGAIAFFLPFLGVMAFAYFVAGWKFHQAEIAGIALSTTSVAVVYAVMVETGFNDTDLGKVILAACFINDLGTVLALGLLFANFNWYLLAFVAATAAVLPVAPRLTRWVIANTKGRISEPEVKFVFLMMLFLGGLATAGGSEAILPAYLLGMVLAGVFMKERVLVQRMRTTAFSILTPFYFIRAGTLVSLPAMIAGLALILAFLGMKVVTKFIGVAPLTVAFGIPRREGMYTTLLMCTGLTFGSISALFGLTHGVIDQRQYTILVTTVVLSAFVPTLIAQQFFKPDLAAHIAEDATRREAIPEATD